MCTVDDVYHWWELPQVSFLYRHWRELPQVSFSSRRKFCHDKTLFFLWQQTRGSKYHFFFFFFFLSRQVSFVVTDKHVTRKTFIMSRQIHRDKSFVAARLLSRQKLYLWQLPPMIQFPPMNDMFGTTKICSGKRRLFRSWLCRVFCRVCPDKNNTVVAAPASDRCGA